MALKWVFSDGIHEPYEATLDEAIGAMDPAIMANGPVLPTRSACS